jgi:hypothetical protein
MSYARTKSRDGSDALINTVVEVPNSNSIYQIREVKIPLVANRVFASKWTWRREPNNNFVIAVTALKDLAWSADKLKVQNLINAEKNADNAVMGEVRGCYRLSQLTNNVCRVTLIGQRCVRRGERASGASTRKAAAATTLFLGGVAR